MTTYSYSFAWSGILAKVDDVFFSSSLNSNSLSTMLSLNVTVGFAYICTSEYASVCHTYSMWHQWASDRAVSVFVYFCANCLCVRKRAELISVHAEGFVTADLY